MCNYTHLGFRIRHYSLIVLFPLFYTGISLASDERTAHAELPLPFIPQTDSQVKQLEKSLSYRQARINEQVIYLKRLHTKLAVENNKSTLRMQQRKRSAIALRIVRIGSQVVIDRVRVLELDARLMASRNKQPPEKLIVQGIPFKSLHTQHLAEAHASIGDLITRMEPYITDEQSRHSLRHLKKSFEKELNR